jgi:hypothetical protein
MINYFYASSDVTARKVANAIEDAGGKVISISNTSFSSFCVRCRCGRGAEQNQIDLAVARALQPE